MFVPVMARPGALSKVGKSNGGEGQIFDGFRIEEPSQILRRVLVLEEAAEDIERGAEFYDIQEEGVGDYFVQCILSDIESLGLFHGIHSMHYGFFRVLSERFPFGIYYRETPDSTEVFAVLDLRKEPTWLRGELEERNS